MLAAYKWFELSISQRECLHVFTYLSLQHHQLPYGLEPVAGINDHKLLRVQPSHKKQTAGPARGERRRGLNWTKRNPVSKWGHFRDHVTYLNGAILTHGYRPTVRTRKPPILVELPITVASHYGSRMFKNRRITSGTAHPLGQ